MSGFDTDDNGRPVDHVGAIAAALTVEWSSDRINAGRALNGGTLPRYGSPDWVQLPEASEVRWAATVLAAEAYRRDGDDLGTFMDRLDANVQAAKETKQAEDEAAWANVASSLRAMGKSNGRNQAGFVAARAVPPRENDYQGGPVDYWTGRSLMTGDGAA